MVREAATEVSAIDVDLAEFGNVALLTSRAIHFEAGNFQAVAEANGQYFLTIAEGARACAIEAREEFVIHLGHAACSVDVPRVDQTIHVTRFLVQL